MKKIKVYVAGPYQKPDPCENTHNAIVAGDKIAEKGMYPFIPHLYHFWHTMIPHDYRFWMDLDFEWLKFCDVFLRLPGKSSGVDKELKVAEKMGIPIFYSVEELINWYDNEELHDVLGKYYEE